MASGVQVYALPASSGVVGPTATDPTAPVSYYGFSVRETAGAAAVFRIREGGVVGGRIIESISLSAGESTGADYLPQGVNARGGLYYEKVSGTIEGSVWAG